MRIIRTGEVYSVDENNKKHGKYTRYHYNGNIHITAYFVHGKCVGRRIEYNDIGEVVAIENCENDLLEGQQEYFFSPYKEITQYKNGKRHGILLKYRKGILIEYRNYQNGKYHGEQKEWNHTGILIRQEMYYRGKYHGEQFHYYDNGRLYSKDTYNKGKKVQFKKRYDNRKNSIHSIEHFDNLYKHGESIFYYETGDVKEIQNWKNNVRHGDFILYYPNGQIKSKKHYFDGAVDGAVVEFTTNGQVSIAYQASKGFLHGEYIKADIHKFYVNDKTINVPHISRISEQRRLLISLKHGAQWLPDKIRNNALQK